MWLITIIMVLTLMLPALVHASDYDTESRLLDLEMHALD